MIQVINLNDKNINELVNNFYDVEIEVNQDFEDQLVLTSSNSQDFDKIKYSVSKNSIELSAVGNDNNIVISGNNSKVIINGVTINNNNIIISSDLKVKLFLKNLDSIKNKGVGNVHLKANSFIETLEVFNQGTGNVTINSKINQLMKNKEVIGIELKENYFIKSLDILNNGTGDIIINSIIKNLNLINKGVGNINCSKSLAELTTVSLSGIGNVLVKSISFSNIKLTGIGNLECHYKNIINSSDVKVSGLGKLIKKELQHKDFPDYNLNLNLNEKNNQFDNNIKEQVKLKKNKSIKSNLIQSPFEIIKNKIKKLL